MLYLKVAELLSSGLQTAINQIRAGKLCLSSTVKQGVCCTKGGFSGVPGCSRQGGIANHWGPVARGLSKGALVWGEKARMCWSGAHGVG